MGLHMECLGRTNRRNRDNAESWWLSRGYTAREEFGKEKVFSGGENKFQSLKESMLQ